MQLDLSLFLWFSVHNQLLSHSFTLQTLLTCATQDDLVYTRIRYVLGLPGVSHVALASNFRTSPALWAWPAFDSSLKTIVVPKERAWAAFWLNYIDP